MGRIVREIRQTRPFPTRSAEALVGLLRTADRVRRALALVIEPHGVTLQQYNVLRILRGAGADGLPTLDIAERMIESAPGITRLLDRLEAKKLVRRKRCERDRRQVLCWLEPAGFELLARLDTPVTAADKAMLSGLSQRRVAELIRLLDEVRAGLEPGAVPPASRTDGKGDEP
jgi:DNA-binding MarR family transcriptional regulator